MAPKQSCAAYEYVVTSAGPRILPVADVQSKDEESPADYNAGGYLPVKVGDTFKENRYIVLRKLGWGHFSTVWLVRDTIAKRHSALKVVKSAGRYAETARDEIKLLSQVRDETPDHPGRDFVVSFLDSFQQPGPEGVHVCIVFEPLGENLLALIERHKKTGVPPALVKVIAKQILLGLEYLHDECDLVHTDIKPENIMIAIPDAEAHIQAELSISPSPTSRKVGVPPKQLVRTGVAIPRQAGRDRHVHIFDSQPLMSPTSASHTSSRSFPKGMQQLSRLASMQSSAVPDVESHSIKPSTGPSLLSQTAPHNLTINTHTESSPRPSSPINVPSSSHAPSRSTHRPPSPPPPTPLPAPISIKIADLGNATPSQRHYTEDIQTRQYRSPEVILGRTDWNHTADIWSAACVIFELLTAEYLFDPQAQGGVFGKDDDHMAQIIELLGDFTSEVKFGGRFSRELFDSTGALRYIRSLKPWPLKRVMIEKYLWNEDDTAALCEFLEPMLVVDYRKRKHARDMKDHKWLEVDPASSELQNW
ncbi:kinase-like protein [Daedalea quercina L-15889]|uniref:non-specific serine/threonine protein kinase n=1 Tax=Daedalea quercina L-15889 TaxID=1314783 RepID=A0A165MDW3_9APHY|nr:kinase-like protein [Daedalea quercina L-15889]